MIIDYWDHPLERLPARDLARADDLPASSDMSDEREIRPAMSPEEWAKWRNGILPELTTHGKAAACLHGQPFGFTWEDVDLLREAADAVHVIRVAWRTLQAPDNADRGRLACESLADRIAALLPPREP